MVIDDVVDFKKAGKRIKLARIERGLSQEELAELSNLSATFMCNIENAYSKASIATFVKIANALGCGVDAFLCDSIKECRREMDRQLAVIFADCTDYEVQIIISTIKGLLQSLREAKANKPPY